MPTPGLTKKPRGRQGGRHKSPFPLFFKKLRATPNERKELTKLLTGDSRADFVKILEALKK